MNRTVEMEMNRNGVTIRRVLHSLQNLYSTAAGLLKAFVLQVVSQATKSYSCNFMAIVKTAAIFHCFLQRKLEFLLVFRFFL